MPEALFELRKTFRFEAAHRLPHLPPEHKCARLHGHSFAVDVVVRGPLQQPQGWVMDFGDVSAACKPVVDGMLDHRYLNDIAGLENPTSEVLSAWLWQQLAARLPLLHAIEVRETCTTGCIYRGPSLASEA